MRNFFVFLGVFSVILSCALPVSAQSHFAPISVSSASPSFHKKFRLWKSRHKTPWHKPVQRAQPQAKYLFIVTLDGLRWQEVFDGVDSALLHQAEREGVAGAQNPAQSRAELMPFLWKTVGRQGQIYGNRHLGNKMNVANNKWFSYPGYNELLTGRPDDRRIFSNAKIENPNTNVLEFLNDQPALRRQVAAFSTWDVFPYIINERRSGVTVCSGGRDNGSTLDTLSSVEPDAQTWAAAFDYIAAERPQVVFIGLDDTDRLAHNGNYAGYLQAANHNDAQLARLWQFIQQDSIYKDQTALIITTDHGRGLGKRWRMHSFFVKHSDQIWMAAIGPGIEPLGEMDAEMQLWQEQIAQTAAETLGYHFECEHRVAPAIESLKPRRNVHKSLVKTEGAPFEAEQKSLKK